MSSTTQTIVPIVDPDRGYREWLRKEIYTGQSGTGRYVPNVDDSVRDWEQGMLRVVEVDYSTGLSVLKAWTEPSHSEVTETDLLLGSGPGYTSESFRLLYDASVMPYVIQPHGRLYCYRSTASYAKIFLGTDINQTSGKVISKYYDASGNLLGENIPLEVVAMEDLTNLAIKAVKTGYTTEKLKTGEVCTIVFYSDDGGVVYTAKLITVETSWIRGVEASDRYITSVEVLSPFRSKNDPNLIEFPINVDLGSVSMLARVNYTDGTKTVAIDGNKCSLLGLQSYISTVLGQEVPLVLSYQLGSDESCYDATNTNGNGKYLTASYRARTIAVDGAYSVKLFPYPCWDATAQQYELHWYLYNLNRDQYYRVDHLIEASATGVAYNPQKIGSTQTFTVAIDLSKVDSRFAKYRHIQQVQLTLLASGEKDQTLWTVTFEPGYTFQYGVEVYASLKHISGGNYRCNLAKEYTDSALWLERFYYDTFPVSNPDLEARPPKPTHFIVEANGHETEYPLAAWNQDFVIPTQILTGQNIYLHWIRRDDTTDLQLGVSGVTVRYESTTAVLP